MQHWERLIYIIRIIHKYVNTFYMLSLRSYWMFQHIFKQKCKCYVYIPLNINKIRHRLHMKKLGVPELNMKEMTIQKSVFDYSSSSLGLAVTLKTCSDIVFGHTTLQLSRKKEFATGKTLLFWRQPSCCHA